MIGVEESFAACFSLSGDSAEERSQKPSLNETSGDQLIVRAVNKH